MSPSQGPKKGRLGGPAASDPRDWVPVDIRIRSHPRGGVPFFQTAEESVKACSNFEVPSSTFPSAAGGPVAAYLVCLKVASG